MRKFWMVIVTKLLPALVFVLLLAYSQGQPHYTEEWAPSPQTKQVSRGEVYRVFIATGYTHTGQRTRSGKWPLANRTVAVDPDIIPLGTKLWVDGFGELVAEDTGGDILGERIDIFFDTEEEAIKWGVRTVRVKVIARIGGGN